MNSESGEVVQVLYVTNFDVAAAASAGSVDLDPAQICFELLGQWIGGRTEPAVPASMFLKDGEYELALAHDHQRRFATWDHLAGEDAWATRVERRDVGLDGSVFITRITVGNSQIGVTVRVSMAREVPDSGLTPTVTAEIHQPAIVAMLVEDKRLSVYVEGQMQDGRYLQVRNSHDVELLVQNLNVDTRLPILLLHTRTLEAQSAAQRAAGRLIGLVRVVTLDYKAARCLQALQSDIDVPYAGGLLIWADMSTPPARITAEQLNHTERGFLRSLLMSRIAPLSVLTRGVDSAYRRARQASESMETRQAAQRSAEAAHSGTLEEQVTAVIAERDRALADVTFATDEWAKAEELAQERAREIARLTAQVEQLTFAAQYLGSSQESAEEEPNLGNAPEELLMGNATSLDALCQHLEQAVDGRIAFTPNVTVAWKKADRYPTPGEMHKCLIKLATVARDMYDGQCRKMGHVDTWVRENHDLRISLQDDSIPKKLRTFNWEKRTYNRVPHVKVNDGVPPAECGRVYFALDNENNRIIVDHIGLHL